MQHSFSWLGVTEEVFFCFSRIYIIYSNETLKETTSSPLYPQLNGLMEKTIKKHTKEMQRYIVGITNP